MLDKLVKLTKSINRKVEGTTYYKFIITIPQKFLDDLKWDDKTKLKMRLDKNKLIIEKE